MRKKSKKRAKLDRQLRPIEQEWLAKFVTCWACGGFVTGIHHMAKGSHRPLAIEKKFCWFAACWYCNSGQLEDYSIWPLARQLAHKRLHDPENYDRPAFNELRGRAPDAISADEVKEWHINDQL